MERVIEAGPVPSLGLDPRPLTAMQRLERASVLVNRALACLAGFALVVMLLFAVADVALRTLGRPLAGSYEVIGWLSATATALVLGSVQQHRGHVAVGLFEARFGAGVRAGVEVVTNLLSLALFAAVAWYVARYARVLQETGSLSETLRLIVYPWVYIVAAGVIGLALALLVDFLRAAGRLRALWRHS